MPSPDCLATIRGSQGWISAARSSSSAAKTTAIIGSITSDLRLGHKTYHCVAFQSLYTNMPETSSSDHPHAATRRSKFLQNHPRASRALNIAPILSPPPLSKSSFSDLHSWKRIGLFGSTTRRLKVTAMSATRHTRHLLPTDITCWRHLPRQP